MLRTEMVKSAERPVVRAQMSEWWEPKNAPVELRRSSEMEWRLEEGKGGE